MVQHLTAASVSRQQLIETLGQSLTQPEFERCLKQIKFLSPKIGQFWHSANSEAGVYIVLKGKIRLVNDQSDLVTTLEAGASWGECTFFPEASFENYGIKASFKVQLGYLPPELLFPLISKYSQIREHFYHQAETRNLLLIPDSEPPATLVQPKNLHQSPDSSDNRPQSKSAKNISAYFSNPTVRVGHLLQRVTRRYPFFAQQNGSDCGAACLVMVARYWGKRFSVSRLRDISNADRNGASLNLIACRNFSDDGTKRKNVFILLKLNL